MDQLEIVSKRDHSFYDAFVFVIATHGGDGKGHRTDHVDSINEKGLFLTSDLVLVEYNKILNFFIIENCPTLANKPKIFIFDCCRGQRGGPTIQNISHHYTTCYAVNSSTPIYQDCMIISSSTSGDSSWGTLNEGSFFAAVFRHILTDSELLESYHFQELLNLISQRTLEVTTKHSYPQIPQRTDLLCRILKFRKRSLLSCYRDKINPTSYSCTACPSSKYLCDNLHWPNSLLFHEDHVFVADGGNHRICLFDMEGKFVKSFSHGLLLRPHGLCANTDGNLIISCWASHQIAIFSTGGSYLDHFGGYGSINGRFDRPTGLAIHPKTNDLFVCDLNNHRVQILNSVFNFVTSIEELLYPQDVKFSSSKVLILDKSDFCIHLYDLNLLSPTGIIISRIHDIGLAWFFSVDTDDNLILPDYVNHCVSIFSSDGKLLHKLGRMGNDPGNFISPKAITLCTNNVIVILCNKNTGRLQYF